MENDQATGKLVVTSLVSRLGKYVHHLRRQIDDGCVFVVIHTTAVWPSSSALPSPILITQLANDFPRWLVFFVPRRWERRGWLLRSTSF